eukprot:COSAG06_NODE_56249_length_285_cov_1.666667_1_plen_31_part_10
MITTIIVTKRNYWDDRATILVDSVCVHGRWG